MGNSGTTIKSSCFNGLYGIGKVNRNYGFVFGKSFSANHCHSISIYGVRNENLSICACSDACDRTSGTVTVYCIGKPLGTCQYKVTGFARILVITNQNIVSVCIYISGFVIITNVTISALTAFFGASGSERLRPCAIGVSIRRNLRYICLIGAARTMMRFATLVSTVRLCIHSPFGAMIVSECLDFFRFIVVANGTISALTAFFGASGSERLRPCAKRVTRLGDISCFVIIANGTISALTTFFGASGSERLRPCAIGVSIRRNLRYICLIGAARTMMRFATLVSTVRLCIHSPFGAMIVSECLDFFRFIVVANGTISALTTFFGTGRSESLCPFAKGMSICGDLR